MTTFLSQSRALPPTDADVARMRERLMEALPVARVRRRRRRRIRFTVGISVAILVAGATTAGAVIQQLASVQARNSSFDCYTTTDVDGPHGTTMFQDAAGSPGAKGAGLESVTDRVRLAVATCEAGYTAVPTQPDAGQKLIPASPHVPDPTACLLGDGRVAVFPNAAAASPAKFCETLGLVAPPG